MAKAELEVPFATINGRLNQADDIYFCTRYGKTVVSHYPKHKNPKIISPRQRALSANFAQAVKQAKVELANPERRAYWQQRFEEQQKTAQKPYAVLRNFVIAELTRQNKPN